MSEARPLSAGYTVPEIARARRVSEDTIRGWISTGELRALNFRAKGKRPRYIVTAEALADFDRAHAAASRSPAPPKTSTRSTRATRPENYVIRY